MRRWKKDGGGGWGEVFVVSERVGGDLGLPAKGGGLSVPFL